MTPVSYRHRHTRYGPMLPPCLGPENPLRRDIIRFRQSKSPSQQYNVLQELRAL